MGEKLTEMQADVLSDLLWANDSPSYPLKWCRPLDLGASNGSHHSSCLNALAAKGMVQFKQRSDPNDPPWGENGKKRWRGRGAKVYRITPSGRAGLAALSEKGRE